MQTRIALVFTVVFVSACGGKKPPDPAPATPGSATAGSAAPDACESAGGKCVSNAADVACKSQPPNACADAQICCVM